MIEVTESDKKAACAYLSGIAELRGKDAITEIYDDHPAVVFAATVRQQAEDAMRERCLAAVDNEKVDAEATGDEGDALYNRAIEDAYTTIRGIDAGGEGE